MPTLAHANLAALLAALGQSSVPVVLNPGHTGGAMEFHQTYLAHGTRPPPLAEFSTLTYVARKYSPGTVTITGVAKQVRVAGMAGAVEAVDLAKTLYPNATSCEDVIATSLSNVNLVLHPPGCVLAAAWVEATGGDFTFYVEGMTDGVGRVMQQLDDERRTVAQAYGHQLPPLDDEMLAIGTVEPGTDNIHLPEKIRRGEANRKIKAPNSLEHRYYLEDFWYGLMPFIALADAADVEVPVAKSLMTIATTMKFRSNSPVGRTAQRMGIQGLKKDRIIDLVRGKE
jgi:opine dehydrogenase